MKLRKYQEEAVEAVLKMWQTCRRVLIVLPTGCGKTVVFASVIKRLLGGELKMPDTDGAATSRRCMVLAHREELVTQAREKIEQVAGVTAQIEMGEMKVTDFFGKPCEVVISSVQTQLNRKEKFKPSDFRAVVVDEAHHAVAKSYREVVGHYLSNPECRLLGVTATPDRADETALGNAFDAVAYEYTVAEAIGDGWLVPVRQKLVKVESLDFSGVSTSAGDLNSAELAQVMEDEKNLHGIVAPTLEICKGKRAILFAASVKQAERISEIVNRSNSMVADWICGATPKDERRQKVMEFKAGKINILCNVGVLTEGFDDAGVEVVVMARPTKSRALYAQMAGRATRPAAEIAAKLGEIETGEGEEGEKQAAAARRALIAISSKPSCLIVDFVGNSGRHKLVSTVDILGGKDLDEETAAAVKRKLEAKAESGGDTLEALEEVRKEIAEKRAAEAKRREFIKATAKYVAISVDPMNLYDLPPVEMRPGEAPKRLSLKQEAILRERIKVDPEKIGYAQSKALLDECFRRMNEGLATLGQVKYLRKFNIPVPMTFAEAKRTLDRCFRKES